MQVPTTGIRQRFGRCKLGWIRLLRDGLRYQQRKNRQYGLVSLSEPVENCSSKIGSKINECRLSSGVRLVQFPYCQYEKPILEITCFVGMFSIEAHLADVVLHDRWILRATNFSKVRKSPAERKIMKVLSQGNWNVASLEETFQVSVISMMIFFIQKVNSLKTHQS